MPATNSLILPLLASPELIHLVFAAGGAFIGYLYRHYQPAATPSGPAGPAPKLPEPVSPAPVPVLPGTQPGGLASVLLGKGVEQLETLIHEALDGAVQSALARLAHQPVRDAAPAQK